MFKRCPSSILKLKNLKLTKINLKEKINYFKIKILLYNNKMNFVTKIKKNWKMRIDTVKLTKIHFKNIFKK